VDNSASYQYIATPMKNMDWIASIILIVSIGATLVILSLLITLFLRDRRHEMGIYLSLGESKLRVAGQILTEVLLIGIIAITLSLFTGNVIAGNLSGRMLNNQIVAEQENQATNSGSTVYDKRMGPISGLDMLGYDSAFSEQELIDSYTVKLGFDTFALFYLVGLGTLLVSTVVPILYVTRLNPKKILM
jgi:putative ABC transport system permease protein